MLSASMTFGGSWKRRSQLVSGRTDFRKNLPWLLRALRLADLLWQCQNWTNNGKKKKKSILVEIAPIFALSSQTPAKGPSWLKSFYQKFLTGFIFYHLFPTHPSLSPILFHCSNLKYFTKERWKYISFISSQKITFSYL